MNFYFIPINSSDRLNFLVNYLFIFNILNKMLVNHDSLYCVIDFSYV